MENEDVDSPLSLELKRSFRLVMENMGNCVYDL